MHCEMPASSSPQVITSPPCSVVDRLILTSGKMVLLDKLLRRLKETGHRVLIFSQMVCGGGEGEVGDNKCGDEVHEVWGERSATSCSYFASDGGRRQNVGGGRDL